MHQFLFLRGVIVGLLIAAPVGPIGLLCIRRTLAHGWWVGATAGVGAALADGVFGALAAFGISAIHGFFVGHEYELHIFGGLFLLALGAYILLESFSAPAPIADAKERGAWRELFSSFIIAISNPFTLASVAVVFAALRLEGHRPGLLQDTTISLGVFAGSLLWWCTLAFLVVSMRKHFKPSVVMIINHTTGFMIMVLGALALWRVF